MAGPPRGRRRGNLFCCDHICVGDRDQPSFGLDNTLCLSAGLEGAERIREPALNARAHDNASAEFGSEEKVDRMRLHRAELIPGLLMVSGGSSHRLAFTETPGKPREDLARTTGRARSLFAKPGNKSTGQEHADLPH